MKLSDIRGERAIEVLADLMEPVAKIVAAPGFADAYRAGEPKLLLVKRMLKSNPGEVIRMLAILEDEPVESYREKVNLLTLPVKLLELLNDEALVDLFTSQGQMNRDDASGSAAGNIGE